MAEVTVWVEEDGFRHSYSVEHEDKSEALHKAQAFIEAQLNRGWKIVTATEPTPDVLDGVSNALRNRAVTFSSSWTLNGELISASTPASRAAAKGVRESDRIIKFITEGLRYELTGWQMECIRLWFDK